MIGRLILALLLALGAMPAMASPMTCHDDPAMQASMAGGDANDHRRHHGAAVAEHVCVGCATVGVPNVMPVDVPRPMRAAVPAVRVPRLVIGASPPPTLTPPRYG